MSVTLSVSDTIATITLNRPEKRNALALDVMLELTAPAAPVREADLARKAKSIVFVVDRSGSMGGERLATAAVAAAASLWRAPIDTSVIAFSDDAIVIASQGSGRDAEDVVNQIFRLRGHGTTDLAFAFRTAAAQLARSSATRKITLLLSDGRATAGDDPTIAATDLDELIVLAPAEDAENAQSLADSVGGRCVMVSGPAHIPEALADALQS